MRILLVEDEPVLGEAVATHLKRSGHAVDWMQRLDDAEAALRSVDYGLILLDLHLPDGRGLDLLRALRKSEDKRPVIILTARDQIRDRIEGLNAGADDYLVKPFDLGELQHASWRCSVVQWHTPARRSGWQAAHRPSSPQGFVRRPGGGADRTGMGLLECLAQRDGTTLSKAQLEEALYAFGAEIESNAVEVYVSRLRKKLGANAIRTVRGLGYRLEP